MATSAVRHTRTVRGAAAQKYARGEASDSTYIFRLCLVPKFGVSKYTVALSFIFNYCLIID